MNKFIFSVGLFLLISAPQLCSSLELGVRPRLNTGFQYYEYNQDNFTSNGLISSTASSIEFSDYVPFVSGGLTLFIDRFFIDGFVQYSFEGQDMNQVTTNNFVRSFGPGITNTSINTQSQFDVNFDRLEYSFSVGYAITDQIVAYAGYKKAHTKFDAALQNGSVNSFTSNIPNPLLSGRLFGRVNLDYIYDGAFVGGAYSHNIDFGFLHGALNANVAVAFLEGNVDVEYRSLQFINQFGVSQNVNIDSVFNLQDLKGDTIGVSAGLSWNGLTTIDGLNYLIGVNGYHYEFDGNNLPNFSETVVRVDFGLSFTF